MTRLVVAGVSTRAAATSAARAGFEVTAIDGYADRDQHPGVRAVSLPRDLNIPFSAAAAAAAATTVDADAVAYLSNFENDAAAVATLSANRALLGNPPDILRRVRDPFVVAAAFQAHGLPVPPLRVSSNPNVSNNSNESNDSNDWLLKPLASGGGHGVRPWTGAGVERPMSVPKGHYLQQRIEGTPGSIVFLAARGRMMPLGVSRQLIGESSFGSHGFRYCGSILANPEDRQFTDGEDLARAAGLLAQAAAAEFGLSGVNGIDFVAANGVPFPIELNPRWTASVELIERAYGINVFALHADACAEGRLPAHGLHHDAPLVRAFGKAIVFAREDSILGTTDDWLSNPDIRDVPHSGEHIAKGSPVCTVFAEATGAALCHAALVTRAEHIYADLDRWRTTGASARHHVTHHQ